VVVDNFHLVRMAGPPTKAYAELLVDPNAVLSLAVALQSFQAVSRRRSQVFEAGRKIEQREFPSSGALDPGR
jgi:hypothetical protein